jgi:transcriptional regulator with XRE-family HTH domain
VPEHGSPSIRRRRLAAELRRLREHAGFTGEEIAVRLGWSTSKISRLERGQSGVKNADLRLLLDLYGLQAPHREDLLALARESMKRTGWIETASFPSWYAAYIYAEAEATTLWNWEPQIVPGLLQTEGYARAAMQGWISMFALPPTELDIRVDARMRRQQILSGEDPLEFSVVIDQSVIRRRFGDNLTMRGQLERLAESSELPNVELRVLPLDGHHPIGTGSFAYMQFAQVHDIPFHDIVVVEQLASNYYVEETPDTHKYRVAFEQLKADALDREQSRDLIIRTARDMWS